ncbi:MAG: J domain-containing protein [Pseudomonadota bacterium]
MTPTEARARLGVDPGATSTEVRRAYLRALKTCKPDQDPVGFMALREAYEVLTNASGWSGGPVTVTPAVTSPEVQAKPTPPAPEPAPGPPPPDPLRELRSTAQEQLLAHAPSLPPELRALALATLEPAVWLHLALARDAARAPEAGVRLARFAFQLAMQRQVWDPALGRVGSGLALAAWCRRDSAAAEGLMEDLHAWLAASEQRAAPTAPAEASAWEDWRVLWGLKGELDVTTFGLLATVAAGEDWQGGVTALERHWASNPLQAYEARTTLRTRAPGMAHRLGLTATERRAPPRRRVRGERSGTRLFAVIALVGLIAAVIVASILDRPGPDPQWERLGPAAIGLGPVFRAELQTRHESACEVRPAVWTPRDCDLALIVMSADGGPRCGVVRAAMDRLRRHHDGEPLAGLLGRILDQACPTSSPEPP